MTAAERYEVPPYLRKHVDRALADAPPLPQEQIDRIVAILRPAIEKQRAELAAAEWLEERR